MNSADARARNVHGRLVTEWFRRGPSINAPTLPIPTPANAPIVVISDRSRRYTMAAIAPRAMNVAGANQAGRLLARACRERETVTVMRRTTPGGCSRLGQYALQVLNRLIVWFIR